MFFVCCCFWVLSSCFSIWSKAGCGFFGGFGFSSGGFGGGGGGIGAGTSALGGGGGGVGVGFSSGVGGCGVGGGAAADGGGWFDSTGGAGFGGGIGAGGKGFGGSGLASGTGMLGFGCVARVSGPIVTSSTAIGSSCGGGVWNKLGRPIRINAISPACMIADSVIPPGIRSEVADSTVSPSSEKAGPIDITLIAGACRSLSLSARPAGRAGPASSPPAASRPSGSRRRGTPCGTRQS